MHTHGTTLRDQFHVTVLEKLINGRNSFKGYFGFLLFRLVPSEILFRNEHMIYDRTVPDLRHDHLFALTFCLQ